MTCFLMSEKTEKLSYYKPQKYPFSRREERYFEQKWEWKELPTKLTCFTCNIYFHLQTVLWGIIMLINLPTHKKACFSPCPTLSSSMGPTGMCFFTVRWEETEKKSINMFKVYWKPGTYFSDNIPLTYSKISIEHEIIFQS